MNYFLEKSLVEEREAINWWKRESHSTEDSLVPKRIMRVFVFLLRYRYCPRSPLANISCPEERRRQCML